MNIMTTDIAVFNHHLYEYEKGLRRLILHTVSTQFLPIITLRLSRRAVCYQIQIISKNRANIFFGDSECIEIIKQFDNKKLSDLSAEQDFILGTMLGYGRIQQCKRYLKRLKMQPKDENITEVPQKTA